MSDFLPIPNNPTPLFTVMVLSAKSETDSPKLPPRLWETVVNGLF